VEIIEIPRLNGQSQDVLSYIAVTANPWASGYSLSKSVSGSNFTTVKTITVPSIIGETLNSLTPSQPFVWDYGCRLEVKIARGTLASLPPERIYEGENAIAVKNTDGFWEIIQFQTAELIGDKTYRLSKLLRGQQGTDCTMANIANNSPLVLLDQHITSLSVGVETLSKPTQYRLTPFGRDIGDDSVVSFTHTPTNLELKPLSPVHLSASRVDTGILLSWKRRTRIDGDSFEALEISLGETTEQYIVRVYDGSTLKRTLQTNNPSVVYENELTDFGTIINQLKFSVTQLSSSVGEGFENIKTIQL
jgi:hypothetical protein